MSKIIDCRHISQIRNQQLASHRGQQLDDAPLALGMDTPTLRCTSILKQPVYPGDDNNSWVGRKQMTIYSRVKLCVSMSVSEYVCV